MPNSTDKKQDLWQSLTDDGYKVGSYDDFSKMLDDPNNLEKLHTNLSADGYKLGTLEEFSKTIYNPSTNRAKPLPTWEQSVATFGGAKNSNQPSPYTPAEQVKQNSFANRQKKTRQTLNDGSPLDDAKRLREANQYLNEADAKEIGYPAASRKSEYETAKSSLPAEYLEHEQIDAVLDKAIAEQQALGDEAYKKSNPNYQSVYGSSLANTLPAMKAFNEQTTPSKIIANIQDKIMSQNGNSNGEGGAVDPMAEKVSKMQAERIYKYVYEKLVERRIPKDQYEAFYQQILSSNSIISLMKAALVPSETLQMKSQAMSDERAYDLGVVGNTTATVMGMALDPITYISGGVGGKVTSAIASRGLNLTSKWGTNAAMRWMMMNGGKQAVLSRIAGSAANFATFEGLGSLTSQMGSGYGVDWGSVGMSTLKGGLMGAGMGYFSNVLGKAKWAQGASTFSAKGAAHYALDLSGRSFIFAGSDLAYKAITDPNFDITKEDLLADIGNAYATNIGFDIYHSVFKIANAANATKGYVDAVNKADRINAVSKEMQLNANDVARIIDTPESKLTSDEKLVKMAYESHKSDKTSTENNADGKKPISKAKVFLHYLNSEFGDHSFNDDDVKAANKCGLFVKDSKELINQLGEIASEDADYSQKYNTDETGRNLEEMMNSSQIGALLQHKNMTESLRNKIVGAITGDFKNPSLITSVGEIEGDEQNGYSVATYNGFGVDNSELRLSDVRYFKTKKEAESYQKESLNKSHTGRLQFMLTQFDLGFGTEFGKFKKEELAKAYRVTPEVIDEVLETAKKKMQNKQELSAVEKQIVEDYTQKFSDKRFSSEYNLNDFNEEFRKSWNLTDEEFKDIINGEYDKLNVKQKNAFRAYEESIKERLNEIRKKANIGVEEQTNEQPVETPAEETAPSVEENTPDQVVFDHPNSETGETDTFVYGSENSNGISMNDALLSGKNAESHEPIKQTIAEVGAKLDATTKELIDAAFANDTVNEMLESLNGQLTDDAVAYIQAKQMENGFRIGAREKMVATAHEAMMQEYGKDSGVVRRGVIKGKEVTITSVFVNGQPTERCHYLDPESGEVKECDWSEVTDMREVNLTNEWRQRYADATNAADAEVNHLMEHEPGTHAEYKIGDTFYAIDKDGNKKMYGVMNVDEQGNVTYGEVGADMKPKNPEVKSIAELQQMEDNAAKGITPEMEQAQTETAQPTAEVAAAPVETPVAETEKPKSALEQIPTDKKGKRLYTQAEPSLTLDAIEERAKGDEGLIDRAIDSQIENAKARVEELSKAEVKSGDIDAMFDAADKNSELLKQAEEEVKYWEAVKKERESRKMATKSSDLMDKIFDNAETPAEEPKQRTEADIVAEIDDAKKQLNELLGITDGREVTDNDINTRTSRESNKRAKANELRERINALEAERENTPEAIERKAAEEKAKAEEEARKAEEQRVEEERRAAILKVIEEEKKAQEEQKRVYEEYKSNGYGIKGYEEVMSKAHAPYVETLQAEAAKYGMKAIVITDSSDVPEEYKGYDFASGDYNAFFDKKRNQFVVYAPNVLGHDHARRIVFHELTSHKGIPGMMEAMGKNPTAFLSDVFNSLTRTTKERWMNYSLESVGTKNIANAIAVANYGKTLDELQRAEVERDENGNVTSAKVVGSAGKLYKECMQRARGVQSLDDLRMDERLELYNQFGHIAGDEYLAHYAEHEGVEANTWDKIVSAVRDLGRKFGIVKDYNDNDIKTLLSDASKYLAKNKNNAAVTQPKEVKKEQGVYLDDNGKVHITPVGEEEAEGNEMVFSRKYKDTIEEASRKKNDRDKKVDKAVLDKAFKDVDEMAEIMKPYENMLPEDKLGGKNVLPNGSYGKTIENTTICVRTLAYNAFCDAVQKKIGRPLTQMESFLVSQKLYDIAVDPQCLYCYVSLDRKAYNEYLNRYIDDREEVIKQWNDAGRPKAGSKKYAQIYEDFRRGRKDTAQMQDRFKMFLANADSENLLTRADLATEESRVATSKTAKAAQLRDALKYAQSASWAKKQIKYTAYSGDILNLSNKWVKDLNSEYGLRFYSFSDYTGAFILENMQQMIDASIRGFKGLAYTKDTNFAKIFAPTGANINISVYAKKDGEGGYYIDDKQSADIEEAIKLREQYPNVGIVCVATDDEGVKWACKQEWSDVVIPFHIVKTGTNVQEFYKWTQYTAEQNDTYKNNTEVNGKTKPAGSKANQITPVEHKNNYDTYMQLCEERGITPRFERFRTEGDLAPEEYMKMVSETRQSAENTPVLQPNFDMDAAKVAFEEFKDKGGYFDGWYNEGVDVDKEVSEVANDVLAGKKANEVSYGRQDIVNPEAVIKNRRKLERRHKENLMFSKKEDEDYMNAVKNGDMETAQKMVNDAAKKAGYDGNVTSRMSHTAPTNDGYHSPLYDLTNMFGEDIYDANAWRYFGFGNEYRDKAAARLLQSLRNNPDKMVTVYRAVPKDVKDTKLRNGDWVTIDKQYAEEHRDNINGATKIISEEVPAKYLFSDGNSLYEQGYDDGSNYGYKNTKNNRKLLDAVTYDDNGDVIPLSKRFNSRNPDIRFSKREEGIYSEAIKAIDDVKSKRATSDQWMKMFDKFDISEEEHKMLNDWMRYRRGMTTKDDVLNFVADARETKQVVDASPVEREDASVMFSKVEDEDKIRKFEKDVKDGNVTYAYRKMQLIDGLLYPPMGAVVDGKLVEGRSVGDLEMSDEHPEKAFYKTRGVKNANGNWAQQKKVKVDEKLINDEDGNYYYGSIAPENRILTDEDTGELAAFFTLKKGTKGADGKKLTDVDARYNSYIHSSNSMCNDQFSSAYNRPNLVTVKIAISNDDLNSGHKRDYCKDGVGTIEWKSGAMSQKLFAAGREQRKVNLSEYGMIVDVIDAKDVAKFYAKELEGTDIEVPFNTVEPTLRDELVKLGIKIGAPENNNAGKSSLPEYKKWLANNDGNDPNGGIRFSIGDKKELRDGRKIEFTKANPTNTFKAVRKFVRDSGFEIGELHSARTGSNYITYYVGDDSNLEISLRSANHTKGTFYGGANDMGSGVEILTDSDGVLFCINMDLSLANLGVKDIKSITNSAIKLHDSKINIDDIFESNKSVEEVLSGKEYDGIIEYIKDYISEKAKVVKDKIELESIEEAGGRPKFKHTTKDGINVYLASDGKLYAYAEKAWRKNVRNSGRFIPSWELEDLQKEAEENAKKKVLDSDEYKQFINDYAQWESKKNEIASSKGIDNLDKYIRFSRKEEDGIERDAVGRPIMPNVSQSEMITPEGRAKYQAWVNAQKEWDKEHPLDRKNRQAAAREVAKVVKQALEDADLNEVETAALNRFLNNVAGTNTFNLVDRTSRAFKIASGAISKANAKTIEKLLSLKLTDRNGKNMTIAGKVDYQTQQIFNILKANWDNFDSDAVQKRIDALNKKMDDHVDAELNDRKPDDPFTQDDSAELTALETLLMNKDLRDITNEVKELIGEQKRLQGDIDALNARMKDAQDTYIGADGEEHSFDFDIAKLKLEAEKKHVNNDAAIEDLKARKSANMVYNYVDDEGKTHVFRDDIAEIKKKMDANDLELNERLSAKMDSEQAIIDKLTDMTEEGVDGKQSFVEREKARRRELVENMNLNLWSDKKVDPQNISEYSNEGAFKAFATTMLNSFEYLAKNLNEYGAGKDSWFYNYFVRGKEGVLQAHTNFSEAMRDHGFVLDDKCNEIFGMDYNRVKSKMSKVVDESGVFIDDPKTTNKAGEQGGKVQLSLSKGQATYLYMLWRMNDGNAQLLRDGFTEESIEQIARFIGTDNIAFADWMQNEYLPEMRKKYNDKYIEMFNTSLAHVENYVPLKRVSEMAQVQSNLSDEKNTKDTLTARTGAIINRTRSKNPIDRNTDAYQLIFDHLKEMESWNAFARVRKDLDYILGNTALKNKMNRNSAGMYNRLKSAAALATLSNEDRGINSLDEVVSKLSKTLAGAPIAYRYTTALKQILSLPNGFRYTTDAWFIPEFIGHAVEDYTSSIPAFIRACIRACTTEALGITDSKASLKNRARSEKLFAGGFGRNLGWCLKNIPDFYERVLKGTAGDANLEFDTWEKALGSFANKYIENGMIPNQLIDAITCGVIIKSVYNGKMRQYKKAGMDMAEADRLAKTDAIIAYNASQQSNHPAFMSPAQKSKKAYDRMYSLFNNANLGFARDFVTSMSDCVRLARPESKSFYAHKLMSENPNLTREEADKMVNKERAKAYGWALTGIAFSGFVGALAWDFGGQGLLGFMQNDDEDDKDKWKGYVKEFASCPGRGIPHAEIGNALLAAYLDNENALKSLGKTNLLTSQISKMYSENKQAYDNFGFSPELAYSVLNTCVTTPIVGVNLDTWVNMYQGVSGLVMDGVVSPTFGTDNANTKEKCLMDLMYLMNSPRSNRTDVIKGLLKEKYADIDRDTYVELVSQAAGYKTEADVWKTWMPNKKMLKDAKKRELEKEFNGYWLTPEEKAKIEENKVAVQENSEIAKKENPSKVFEDYSFKHGHEKVFAEKQKVLSEYQKASSAFEAWERLKRDKKRDEADAFKESHEADIEFYKKNRGKITKLNAYMAKLVKEGDEDTYETIIDILSE